MMASVWAPRLVQLLFQLLAIILLLLQYPFSKDGTTGDMGWIVAVQAASAPTRVTWVNGIGHNLLHMEEGNQILSKLFGGKDIQFCHNPTAMAHDEDFVGLSTDLLQAGTQKLGRITEEVNNLVRYDWVFLPNIFEKKKKRLVLLMIPL
jgi:hypothetical protein